MSGVSLEALKPLVGEWRMAVSFKDVPPTDAGALIVFEWFPGERFLIQRWEIPVTEAPDGMAVIGADPENEGDYLQHYFDSRGVARVYNMSFGDGVWKLWRAAPDFTPLDFLQRYTGTFSDDGKTIAGAWEICHYGKTHVLQLCSDEFKPSRTDLSETFAVEHEVQEANVKEGVEHSLSRLEQGHALLA